MTVRKTITKEEIRRLLKRDPNGNKGTFGKLMVVAGSETMAGAAYFAAKAALRAGCGMVKVITAKENRIPLLSLLPEGLYRFYDSSSDLESMFRTEMTWADCALIGPGLSTSELSVRVMKAFLAENSERKLPAVIDADGLNLLSLHPSFYEALTFPCVLTPHVGEMSRLTGLPIGEIRQDPEGCLTAFTAKRNLVCILKDAISLIHGPGEELYESATGTSALATAGSGDVLSGITGILLRNAVKIGMSPVKAAAAAAYLHGLAGRLAGERLGEASVLASDVVESIPEVWKMQN